MKPLLLPLLFCTALLTGPACAQTKAVLKTPATNALTENLVVPAGKTLTVNPGATIVNLGTATGFGTASGVAWGDITGTPTTLAGYGIVDGLTPAAAAAAYVSLSGSYVNPSWVSSLPWSKITGAPSFLIGNQTITLSGDITGSGTTSIAATLANSGVTAGSYTAANVTVDGKGRVTAVSSTTPLPANPAGSGFLTNDGSGPAWTSYGPDVMAQSSPVVYAGDVAYGNNYTGLRLPSNNGVHAFLYSPNGLVETFAGTNEVPIQLPSVSGVLLTSTGNGGSLTNLDPYALQQRGATDGQVLSWSTANARWQPASVGGSGTVTSVGLTGSNGITVTGATPITTSGSWALSVDAPALKSHLSLNNVENTALSTWAGSANLTTLGTITAGTWQGTNIEWSRVSKTGSSLADLATRSAGDLTSGTLDAARLPAPTTTALGGVKRNTGAAGEFVAGIAADGSLTYATPSSGGGASESLAQLDADVSVTDNLTFQELTTGTSAIEFAVEADKSYKIEFEFSVRANATTTGFEVGLDGPASPASIFATTFLSNTATGESGQVTFTSAYGSVGANANSGGATARPAFGLITFRNGPNAGTLKLQVKVESGVIGTVTVGQGSNATLREITP